MPTPRIIACTISSLPKSVFDPMPQVTVWFEDKTSKVLFEYYPDEISFIPDEFIGLTEAEAHQLKFTKDKNYLQS